MLLEYRKIKGVNIKCSAADKKADLYELESIKSKSFCNSVYTHTGIHELFTVSRFN